MEQYLVIREKIEKGDALRDKDLKFSPNVEVMENISYGDHDVWQKLDIFMPKKVEGKLPVIINFHGGGWIACDKISYRYYCASLAEEGFVVMSFNYRLAPEYRFPTSLHDCNSAIQFFIDRKDEYHLDLNNVFAVGDSAGAHLLSLYCCLLTNDEFSKSVNIMPIDIKFNAIALNCGKYDLFKFTLHEGPNQQILMDYLLGDHKKESLKRINTVDYVNNLFPPTYLMTSNCDFLRTQAPFMEKALKKNNIEYVYKKYGDKKTELRHVFHVNMNLKEAYQCNNDELAFFKKHLK